VLDGVCLHLNQQKNSLHFEPQGTYDTREVLGTWMFVLADVGIQRYQIGGVNEGIGSARIIFVMMWSKRLQNYFYE